MFRRLVEVLCVHCIEEKDCMARFATGAIENTRVALGCTLPPVWLVPTSVYLIIFLIGKLSYSPCSEPSHTVFFPFSPM